jgi:hypothetical protein
MESCENREQNMTELRAAKKISCVKRHNIIKYISCTRLALARWTNQEGEDVGFRVVTLGYQYNISIYHYKYG